MKLFSTLLRGDAAQLGERLRLATPPADASRAARGDRRRDDRLDQRPARAGADRLRASSPSARVDADVAGDELGGVLELGERLLADISMAGSVGAAVESRQAFLTSSSYAPWSSSASVSPGFGDLDLEEPARRLRVAVGERGIGAQRLVDLDDLAADRHVQVGRRLHRLDHAGDVALGEGLADGGQVDEDDVAERVLRMLGDADGGRAGLVEADPLVVGGVLDGHSLAPGKDRGEGLSRGSSDAARRAWR
jgi:hypothetical protein